jgi:iron(III) transport system ATP-binding protein
VTELRIDGLTKAYGPDTTVLDRLDLTVPGGSLAAVLGPSGCGKTTLLRIVAGFLRADAGTVSVGGRVLTAPGTHVPPERRRIGIVPQEGALFPHLSVARNVAFGVTDRAARRRRTEEMLHLVGLAGYGDRMPHELSGGQQQRAAVARALVTAPALVLADEPTGNLDSDSTEEVLSVFDELSRLGRTVVMITHEHDVAARARRIVGMRDGRVVSDERTGPVLATGAA